MNTDMSKVIEPRSDQINADDFMSGPQTFTLEDVSISPGTEQPVSIRLQGEKKVWRPCKSTSRVLVAAWGPDASKYAGRSVTLYRDPTVKWGGLEVGGIRISHLSHIDKTLVLALTASKGNRKPVTIKPLADVPAPDNGLEAWAASIRSKLSGYSTIEAMKADWDTRKVELKERLPDVFKPLNAAVAGRAQEITAAAVED